jgi:hypothetical protein
MYIYFNHALEDISYVHEHFALSLETCALSGLDAATLLAVMGALSSVVLFPIPAS